MKRPPIVATIVVVLAAALMVALGIWQLDRRHQKEALLAQLATNAALPEIAFPGPGDWHALLFRHVRATCGAVSGWTSEVGRGRDGAVGWRKLAACATGTAGPRFLVDTGVTGDPASQPDWRGGPVTGPLVEAPRHQSVIARAFGGGGAGSPMIVADTPAPGLTASSAPTLDSIPNNHLAYAVQWFVFAALSLIIYALALRRRAR